MIALLQSVFYPRSRHTGLLVVRLMEKVMEKVTCRCHYSAGISLRVQMVRTQAAPCCRLATYRRIYYVSLPILSSYT